VNITEIKEKTALDHKKTVLQANVEQANAVFLFLKSLSQRDLRVLDGVIRAFVQRGGRYNFNADDEPLAAFAQRIRHMDVHFIELNNCVSGLYEDSLGEMLQWQEMLRLIYLDSFGGLPRKRLRKRRSNATQTTTRTRTRTRTRARKAVRGRI
jgi:hypothetical protein